MEPVTITREEMLAGIVKPDKAPPIAWDKISDALRYWIGGNHDGDGCSLLDYKHGPRITVGKAENGWGTLETLKLLLGGKIYDKAKEETEEQQAQKNWTITGRTALQFCEIIQRYCFLKRPQLVRLCEYPVDDLQIMQMQPLFGVHHITGEIIKGCCISDIYRKLGKKYNGNISLALDKDKVAYGYRWISLANPVSKEETQKKCREIEEELHRMKHVEHEAILGDLPSPYVAGLTDSDGMIYFKADCKFPRISVGQKYAAICNALKRQYGGSVHFRMRDGFQLYHWDLVGQQDAQNVIREILPFLIEKKTQAELALSMLVTDDLDKVRAAFQKLKGRQGANLRKKRIARLLKESQSVNSQ